MEEKNLNITKDIIHLAMSPNTLKPICRHDSPDRTDGIQSNTTMSYRGLESSWTSQVFQTGLYAGELCTLKEEILHGRIIKIRHTEAKTINAL